MSSGLALLIQAGHDLTSFKYYVLATGTILFYDHLLTLADEIKYVWSERKSWTFWLFFINRYFPMTFQFWILGTSYTPDFPMKVCDKTAWYSIFTFVVCTLLAQVVLTLRIYAVTKKHIPTAIGFAIITGSQLALGIFLVAFAARGGAQQLPPIPFDAFHLCLFSRHRTIEIAYTGISLLYDLLAFSLTIFVAARSKTPGLKIPNILQTIAEDATRYFLVIFTSHFVLVMTLNLGRESLQLLPASGNIVYLPVMISRIMLSLRKAADLQQNGSSLGEQPTNEPNPQPMRFFRPRRRPDGWEDDIPLDTIQSRHNPEPTQSRAVDAEAVEVDCKKKALCNP